MSKHDARLFLDRLIQLRGAYQALAHETTPMTVQIAIAYAIELLGDPDRLVLVLDESTADGASSLHKSDAPHPITERTTP